MPFALKTLLAETDDVLPLFALARVAHPVVVEMFGLAGGYRGFWFDQEHASFATEQIATLAIAARANAMDSFVRMPAAGYWQVTQALEAGAGGVMGAQINSVEEARQFVSWAKFAPEGVRGLNTSGFDAQYGRKPVADFVREANRQNLVAIQIETLSAVEQASDIAATEGVDVLFVGPADLSLVLGRPGDFHSDTLWEAITHVAQAARQAGKHWGAVIPDARFAERAAELGCRLPTVGNDVRALAGGIEAMKANVGRWF